MRRVIVPAGIAAAVLVALGTVFWSSDRQSASAAQRLRSVAAANISYNGWIEINVESPLGKPIVPGSIGPVPKYIRYYVHPVRRIIAEDSDNYVHLYTKDTIRHVRWQDHGANVLKQYSSSTGELVVSPMPPVGQRDFDAIEQGVTTLRTAATLTVAKLLECVRFVPTMDGIAALVDSGWCTVDMTQEDGRDIYQLALVKERLEDPRNAPALTIVVDRTSGLVQNWTATLAEETLRFAFRYEGVAPTDIADLGLPADVKVVQRQPVAISPDVQALVDRLDRQVDTDGAFGDCTALLTSTQSRPDGPTLRAMEIFGRRGAGVFHARFVWNPLTWKHPLARLAPWPELDVDDVITNARSIPGSNLEVCDGRWVWIAEENLLHKVTREDATRGNPLYFTLSGKIWPGRHVIALQAQGPLQVQVDLLADEQRPGLVGLHAVQSGWAASGDTINRIETTWWLDPARGDVPVEKIEKWYDRQGVVTREESTTYGDHAQTATGQWYPQTWRVVTTEMHEGKATTSTEEFLIQVRQDYVLVNDWFADPALRYNQFRQPVAPRP